MLGANGDVLRQMRRQPWLHAAWCVMDARQVVVCRVRAGQTGVVDVEQRRTHHAATVPWDTHVLVLARQWKCKKISVRLVAAP